MMINGHKLTTGELGAYAAGDMRGRRAYLKRHGSPAVSVSDARVITFGDYVDTSGRGRARTVQGLKSAAWASESARDETLARVRSHAAAWKLQHGQAYDAAGYAAGVADVRKLYAARIAAYDAGVGREVCPASGEELAGLAAARDAAVTRLAELGLSGRKRATRTPVVDVAPVAAVAPVVELVKLRKTSKLCPCDAHASAWSRFAGRRLWEAAAEGGPAGSDAGTCEVCALIPGTDHYGAELVARGRVTMRELHGAPPAVELEPVEIPAAPAREVPPAVPATVPAPMPRQTRAARKESNRELAAAMRAAGLAITPDAWEAAKAGTLAGFSFTPAGV